MSGHRDVTVTGPKGLVTITTDDLDLILVGLNQMVRQDHGPDGDRAADLFDLLAEVYTRLPDDADLIEPPELRCGTDGFHVGACDEWCWDERRWDEDERCWS